jgi:hypothetical protein
VTTSDQASAARRAPADAVERMSAVSLRRLKDGTRTWLLVERVRPDDEAALRAAVALVIELDAQLEQRYPSVDGAAS